MSSLKDYLQLFRAHTAPLEVLIALLGATLGAGGLFNLNVLYLSFFGFLYHITGYGQNSLVDFLNGYDKADPHKSHHPLERGAINVKSAGIVIKALFVVLITYAFFLSRLKPIPILLLFTALFMGLLYNLKGKGIRFKFLPIATAHSLIFPFAYFTSGGESLFIPLILSTFYFFFQITYQILIEGDIKDIDVKEEGLLREMGVKLKKGKLFVAWRIKALGLGLKAISIILALLLWYYIPSTPGAVFLIFFSLLMLYYHFELLKGGRFDHGESLKNMALEEVSSVYLMGGIFTPYYGLYSSLLIMITSTLYFVFFNRYLWGTTLTPRV